jgi:hypothetical protein
VRVATLNALGLREDWPARLAVLTSGLKVIGHPVFATYLFNWQLTHEAEREQRSVRLRTPPEQLAGRGTGTRRACW